MGFITEKGVLTYKSQVETGTSKSGNTWQKQTIVVSRENVNAPYDKVALSVFGDKVNDSERCRVGDKVEITYSISAKEYNGRWYNDVSLYKVIIEYVKGEGHRISQEARQKKEEQERESLKQSVIAPMLHAYAGRLIKNSKV